MTHSIIPILLCGGSGNRLQPLSTPETPKQFIPFFADDSNLLQHALMRASLLHVRPIVVANIVHEHHVAETIGKSGVAARVVFEAFSRNTAAASLRGALMAAQVNTEALVCIMPCDHVIMDMESFAQQIKEAAEYAASGHIVLFGIPPAPSSEYGFIIRTPLVIGEGDFYPVESFTEKPSVEASARLIETGRSFINSGIFLMPLRRLIGDIERQQPSLYSQVAGAFMSAEPHPLGKKVVLAHPSNVPSLPLDKAIIEQADGLVVAPARFDWADVGSKEALARVCRSNASVSKHIRQFLEREAAAERA